MKKNISKIAIIFIVLGLGGGLLFQFGIKYFLNEQIGIEPVGMGDMADNLPPELSGMKWILGGAGVLMTIVSFLPFVIIGLIGFFIFRKKWNSLNKKSHVQDASDDIGSIASNTKTYVNDVETEGNLAEIIQNALHNQQLRAAQASNGGGFPGMIFPIPVAETNSDNSFATQASADIVLRAQAGSTLLTELKNKGGISSEAKVISQNVLFENAMPDVDAVELRFKANINGKSEEGTQVIFTPKTSLYKMVPQSTIHILYDAENPKRMVISGTDQAETTTIIN